MAMSVSKDIKENSITFNNNSLISNNDNWKIDKGNITLGNVIIMGSKSKCTMETKDILENNLECNYLKLLAHLTCDDKTLSTETVHNVSVCYTITYIDSENNEQIIIDCFYPKYDFEDDYINDYSVIAVPSNKIKSIKVSIINNEDIEVKVTKTGLYYSRIINEQTIKDSAVESVQEAINEGTMDLVIPIVDTLPDINSVPDGYICRLSTMEAKD